MKTMTKLLIATVAIAMLALTFHAVTDEDSIRARHVLGHIMDEDGEYHPVSTRRWYAMCDDDTCAVRDSVREQLKNQKSQ